jgi:hypothetical protein
VLAYQPSTTIIIFNRMKMADESGSLKLAPLRPFDKLRVTATALQPLTKSDSFRPAPFHKLRVTAPHGNISSTKGEATAR